MFSTDKNVTTFKILSRIVFRQNERALGRKLNPYVPLMKKNVNTFLND